MKREERMQEKKDEEKRSADAKCRSDHDKADYKGDGKKNADDKQKG